MDHPHPSKQESPRHGTFVPIVRLLARKAASEFLREQLLLEGEGAGQMERGKDA